MEIWLCFDLTMTLACVFYRYLKWMSPSNFALQMTRGAKISPKAKPEPRLAPHEICWAQRRARPASFKHRTKPGSQCIIHCDRLPRTRHKPSALSPGSAKGPAGPKFWARPGRRAWTLNLYKGPIKNVSHDNPTFFIRQSYVPWPWSVLNIRLLVMHDLENSKIKKK